MSRKITMPKCPYCGEEKKYQFGEYDTSRLVSLATGVVVSDVTIKCAGCGKDYKVSCNIRFYGGK